MATGWGSALIAWWGVRAQQREQWRAENLRLSYSAVVTSFRPLMMAWWTLCHRGAGNRDTAGALHDQVGARYATFTSACAAAILLAPDKVQDSIVALRDAVVEFDQVAEGLDFVNHDRRDEVRGGSPYEVARQKAEDRQRQFIEVARADLR